MDHNLKVSILMPIYKVEQYLEKALDSIFSQTYPNVEYIFVNDCSPDNSLLVLTNMISKHGIDKDSYVIVNHQQNEGVAVSRAECIENARGDYVYFVDSDDWIEENAVEKMVYATGNGTIDLIGCDYIDEFGDGKSSYHYENYGESCSENLVRCLNYDVSPVLWKMLIKRQLFDNIDITPHLNIGEDYSISVKLYYFAKSFFPLHEAYYHYAHYNLQKLSFQRMRSLEDHVRVVKEVEKFLRHSNCYGEEIRYQLNLRKFNIKSNFLNKSTLNYRAYKKTFPDVNNMWQYMDYTVSEKIKFWLAGKDLFFILSLLQKLSH